MKIKPLLLATSILLLGAGCGSSQLAAPTTQPIPDTAPPPSQNSFNSEPPPTPPPADQSPPPAAGSVSYKDGSYTGAVADAFYGPIQVQAVIKGGKLTDVKFLQYPNKPGHTTDVSNSSMPVLKQEAIASQSARVDNISGATQTTDGFKVTLGDALAQAKS